MRWLSLLFVLLALAGCGGRDRLAYGPGLASYPEPGPPGDPWRPYIRQASSRFGVPQRWIRAVMQRESHGQEYRRGRPITSSAGAMGLMQLMPATYADMQEQNGLGRDPYEPRDNILAGAAYIRAMYGRYGAPAFLAAYNAGPQRLDDYLAGRRTLPNETVNYVASITPYLGVEAAATPPAPAYAASTPRIAPRIRLVAYRVPVASPAYGVWAIQVGAYLSAAQARSATTMARQAAYAELSASIVLVQPTSRPGRTSPGRTSPGRTSLYRARLAGLAHGSAGAACIVLERHGIPCMIVAPGG